MEQNGEIIVYQNDDDVYIIEIDSERDE